MFCDTVGGHATPTILLKQAPPHSDRDALVSTELKLAQHFSLTLSSLTQRRRCLHPQGVRASSQRE